jgi:hypothetical protein
MPVEHPDNWKDNDSLRSIGSDNLKTKFYQSQQEVIAVLKGMDDVWLNTTSTHYGRNFAYLPERACSPRLLPHGTVGPDD